MGSFCHLLAQTFRGYQLGRITVIVRISSDHPTNHSHQDPSGYLWSGRRYNFPRYHTNHDPNPYTTNGSINRNDSPLGRATVQVSCHYLSYLHHFGDKDRTDKTITRNAKIVIIGVSSRRVSVIYVYSTQGRAVLSTSSFLQWIAKKKKGETKKDCPYCQADSQILPLSRPRDVTAVLVTSRHPWDSEFNSKRRHKYL